MAEKTMHHAVIGADTFELVDQSARADVSDLKNALPTKAEQDGAYPDLTAGQMLSKVEASDSVPYNFRAVGHDATLEYTDAIVGGSVVANQLVQNGNFTNTNGWTAVGGATISASNNTLSITGAAGGMAVRATAISINNTHRFMIVAQMKADSTQVSLRSQNTWGHFNVASDGSGNWQTIIGLLSSNISYDSTTIINVQDSRTSGWTEIQLRKVMLIDLTQALGTTIADYVYTLETATSGAGVAWLRKHFPKLFTYQEYNAGEIVSVHGLSQHVTVGFNQWDEEWEVGKINDSTGQNQYDIDQIRSKNYIQVLPNTTYYIRFPNFTGRFYCYDNSKGFIGTAIINNSKIETPSNCYYIRFRSGGGYGATYNHDICINLSDPTRNGEYEPYQKRTYSLDDSLTLRGILKLDSNNQLYADGDRYLPSGQLQRSYALVDLGTLDWEKQDVEDNVYNFRTRISGMKLVGGSVLANIICPKYTTVTTAIIINANAPDKSIAARDPSLDGVRIVDTAYTDAASFKTAMSGVMLLYEVATPTTEEADPYTVPQIVDPDGTEEYVSTSIVPVGHESRYPLDIAGRLDKILTMPTANGTYTLRATVNNGAVTYSWVST